MIALFLIRKMSAFVSDGCCELKQVTGESSWFGGMPLTFNMFVTWALCWEIFPWHFCMGEGLKEKNQCLSFNIFFPSFNFLFMPNFTVFFGIETFRVIGLNLVFLPEW